MNSNGLRSLVLGLTILTPGIAGAQAAGTPVPVGARPGVNAGEGPAEVTGYIQGPLVLLELIVPVSHGSVNPTVLSPVGTFAFTSNGVVGSPPNAKALFSLVVSDVALVNIIGQGLATVSIPGNGATLTDVLRRARPLEGVFTVNGPSPGGGYFTVFEQTGQMVVQLGTGTTQANEFELVEGTPQNPGSTTIPLGTGPSFNGLQLLTKSEIDVIKNGTFARVKDGGGNVLGTGDSRFERRLRESLTSSTDGATDNAIATFQLLPGDGLAGTVLTADYPETVTAVDLREVGTNALMAIGVNLGGGVFGFQPIPLSPAQLASFRQNLVELTLFTASGNDTVRLQDPAPVTIIGAGTPGSDGSVGFTTMFAPPLVGFGYGVQVYGATPNALMAMIVGLELHDPPTLLSPFGLDDVIYVKVGATLPLATTAPDGSAVFTGTLPNDTTFAGVPLFAQGIIFSGNDGVAVTNACIGVIGPDQ